MRALLILWMMCLYYTNGDLSTNHPANVRSVLKLPSQKLNGKILINSGHYKPIPRKDKGYTVFQMYGFPKKANGIPDSPYFSIDKRTMTPRTRVKKMLPDVAELVKEKRSVDNTEFIREKRSAVGTNVTSTLKPSSTLGKAITKSMKVLNNTAIAKANGKNVDEKVTKIVKREASIKKKPSNATIKKPTRRKGKAVAKPKAQRRLTGGREALIEDYPYVISIQKDGEHWCSGAILNQRLAITTANCMWKAQHVSRMTIRAGSKYTTHGGQEAGIQEVLKHPGWGLRRGPDFDVALVLMDKNLKFSHSCHAVDLPNRVMYPTFDDVWVTSWGSERRDGIFDEATSYSLQVYHARLMNRDECNNITKRFGVEVSENFICVAQSGKTAPCTRDTGAPGVSDGILWGLASWGLRKLCGTERYPAMFSYLASHRNMDFIMNATHYLMSDKREYPFPDRFPFDPQPKPVYQVVVTKQD